MPKGQARPVPQNVTVELLRSRLFLRSTGAAEDPGPLAAQSPKEKGHQDSDALKSVDVQVLIRGVIACRPEIQEPRCDACGGAPKHCVSVKQGDR